jgi:hypothetical protein
MENIGIFYDHLVYFTALEIFCGNLAYFSLFWYFGTKKNLATLIQFP